MRMSAVAVASALGVSAIGLGAHGHATASGSTQVVHFSGQSASAVLTDCVLVPDTHCRAVSVNAFERRANPDEPSPQGPGVLVTLFDVTIVAAQPPTFVAEEVGSGVGDDVTVRIPHGLPHGTAMARNVALERCDFSGPPGVCEPAGSVSVEVRWDASGPARATRFHEMFADPFARFNDRGANTSRPADASGTLDGSAVDDSALFPSQLSTSSFGSVSRFGPLAMSIATAAAVATAASVAHTMESSASAALTNCPPAPRTGTVCDGVLVSAFSLVERGAPAPARANVSAAFFELTVTPGGFIPRFIGSGGDESATFDVEADLVGATADAVDPRGAVRREWLRRDRDTDPAHDMDR